VKRLNVTMQPWMRTRSTRAVMRALTRDGAEARFVGGAVRNALLEEKVGDIDIATPLVPEEVMGRLQAAGLGAVPTGIAHGTITAIAAGRPFEVTTLRRDVATDGRRATVAYTTDWAEDASRRDFTMNALYAAEDGRIFDYTGGLADLRARRVRFVGDPRTRIREDYLRILRLFRFHAWYGRGEIDREALAAAIEGKAGLKTLSGERVQKEVLRLLQAQDPTPTLLAMQGAGILAEILPENLQLPRLARLVAIEAANKDTADALLRLAALLPDEAKMGRALSDALKLSNADRARLVEALESDRRIAAPLAPNEARKLLYRLGKLCFRDQLLLRWADANAKPEDPRWIALLRLANSWVKPEFPLNGRDAMAAGIDEGPKVGVVLRALEQEWVEADFQGDRRALLRRLRETVKNPRK
jgi:poly(A) polymerase